MALHLVSSLQDFLLYNDFFYCNFVINNYYYYVLLFI